MDWMLVERSLRGSLVGAIGPSEHRAPVVPGVRGLSQTEHAVRHLRMWERGHACRHSLLGPNTTVTEVLRVASALPGFGPYAAVCLANSLVARRSARWIGPVGPGAENGIRVLQGSAPNVSACQGVWPWSRDPKNLRGVVIAIARECGVHFLDAQHTLCNWSSPR